MSEREDWINLIRNEYDPMPDLGRANYSAFESGWDDGAGRIADAIIANKTLLLADKLEAVSSLGGYIMESKEAAQIVTALRSISSLSAETVHYKEVAERYLELLAQKAAEHSHTQARLAEAVELIKDMAEAITAEVNEKGGGGSILARLSDARRFLVGGS
jgi:uncharacterized protein YyaL (SSP411 family)